MTVVVDTSVLIDHLRGHEGARDVLSHAVRQGERLAASVLTKAELLPGMPRRQRAAASSLFTMLEWVPVDEELAEDAGSLASRYLRSHPGIDMTDYVIAATARRLDAGLWTRNVKHFPMFTGLKAPYSR